MRTFKCSCNKECPVCIYIEDTHSASALLFISVSSDSKTVNIYLDTESTLELIRELKSLLLARKN
jgi:hypothetical protein